MITDLNSPFLDIDTHKYVKPITDSIMLKKCLLYPFTLSEHLIIHIIDEEAYKSDEARELRRLWELQPLTIEHTQEMS